MYERVRGWIVEVLREHPHVLTIAIRQRAKFEGWLKFELAAYLEQKGATEVEVEACSPDATSGYGRSDLAFRFDGVLYDLQLKTPNTNWRLPGVANRTRPITQNVNEIITDARNLVSCQGIGLVAFVLFPIPVGDSRWIPYLERIAASLNAAVSPANHTVQVTLPLGAAYHTDVVVCCFPISSGGSNVTAPQTTGA